MTARAPSTPVGNVHLHRCVMLDVLIIAPHPDDAELGMGGAIARFVAEGRRVGILDLTNGEPTPHGSPEIRARETAAASELLGIPWRENLGLANRSLEHTLDARHKLAGVIRRTRPKWLFAPYWTDAHPDHVAATSLVEAARFWAKLTKSDIPGEPHHPQRIYNYYCVHLKLTPQPAFVLDISEHWPAKAAAVGCYESQFITGRPAPSGPDDARSFLEQIEHAAAYWGQTIGVRYGEPFACREPIGLASMANLL